MELNLSWRDTYNIVRMASRVTRSRRQVGEQQEQQSRARWTTFLTRVLVELMVEQVHKGNKHNNSFGKKTWKHICDGFYNKTGMSWDKEQLKYRYAALRRQHAIVNSLVHRTDFSWDESTGTIIANDQAWADYIKGHPDAETIRSSGCPMYKELCTIFSEPANNGKHDQSVKVEEGNPSSVPLPEPLNTIPEESSSETDEEVEAEDVADDQPRTPSTTNYRKRGRKGIDGAIAGAILEMAAASKMRTHAVKQCNTRYSIANCIKELDELQGIDEHVYFAALDLFNNPVAREIFLSLKLDKRLIWLRHKCTALSSALS
ncbi:Myb_DNA-bind_3 domain-containing protein [Cephalotus follicularis]|uniref:Myb_DNA-bind_3 domain-containing protein n=1 Tax=Cephalotus follicularis TaxID=3775 RepID=A0A1Q3BA32_CEPFO|nr:Myb_DNA-bind_3 domain-containing protein [Cephalotus follicularis]